MGVAWRLWIVQLTRAQFPTQPAQVCAEDAGDITIDGDPKCTTQTQSLDTEVKGTNGTATVSQTTGTKFTSEQTVSRTSLISYSVLSPTHSHLFRGILHRHRRNRRSQGRHPRDRRRHLFHFPLDHLHQHALQVDVLRVEPADDADGRDRGGEG